MKTKWAVNGIPRPRTTERKDRRYVSVFMSRRRPVLVKTQKG